MDFCCTSWQDQNFLVHYTDVDYLVFTDAARYTFSGGSPFDRHTYRYTPLLAYLVLPNLFLHQAWGKLVFCLFDLVVGALIEDVMVKAYGASGKSALAAASMWLLNPLSINVSTRGNADSIVCALVLGTAQLVIRGHSFQAGLLHGVSVHYKIFPVIFSLSYLMALPRRERQARKGLTGGGNTWAW